MKKAVIVVTIATLIAVGAIAYAQGPGWHGGDSCGPCYGPGYHMKGAGFFGPMSRCKSAALDQKFLDETFSLRKELHNKRFDYFEALRNPKTDPETITKLEREMRELKDQLAAKAPQKPKRGYDNPCWRRSCTL